VETAAPPALRRRQVPATDADRPYIADFCCPALRLIVELDGGVHALRVESDTSRDAWLTGQGFRVLRFGNEAVLRNPALVFEAVREAAARDR